MDEKINEINEKVRKIIDEAELDKQKGWVKTELLLDDAGYGFGIASSVSTQLGNGTVNIEFESNYDPYFDKHSYFDLIGFYEVEFFDNKNEPSLKYMTLIQKLPFRDWEDEFNSCGGQDNLEFSLDDLRSAHKLSRVIDKQIISKLKKLKKR